MLRLFVIKPSGMFASLLLFSHLSAVISLCLTNFPLWARLALSLLIGISMLHQIYRFALLRARRSWVSFSLDQNQVVVNTLDGNALKGELMQGSVVTAICVALCVRLPGRRLPVCQVVFRDALPGAAFRELRVRLRYA